MTNRLIPKKRLSEIERSRLSEPDLSSRGRECMTQGMDLFNSGRYWEAHEVWEDAWRECEEDGRIFIQGIIQAAAGYHLVFERPRPAGAARNLHKALEKLELFPVQFLGFDVAKIREEIREALRRLGEGGVPPAGISRPFIARGPDQ